MVAKLRTKDCVIGMEKKRPIHNIEELDVDDGWPLIWCKNTTSCTKKRLRGKFNYECITGVGKA